ncbi:MAG TPA: ATP-binding protein, partial [Candidatus Limnocylindria bacterium]|nr:ATP-binding protein [Candidatus Limnocylindria bacterium]
LELGVASSIDALLRSVVNHLGNATRSQVAILLPQASGSELAIHPASSLQPEVMELSAAEMAFRTGQVCGQFTVRFAEARAFFIPLKTAAGTEGVLGIRWSDALPPDVHEESFLGAFSQQIALALDRHRLQALSEKSRLFAESEKLSKTLLNSISHEIRTPIAAIKSATNNLVELGDGNLNEAQLAMVGETLEAVDRLNRLVGNVLDITRIESGHVRPRMALCDVQDLVHVALKETKGRLEGHPVELDLEPGLPLVRMDFVLMQQVLTNLLSNAGFHTPPGTPVTVRVGTDRSELILCVSDRGPGLPNGAAARIFEKFYRGPTAPAGGTGLGLSLVKGFVEAHRGSVVAENRRDGGASFTVRLPVDKVLTPAMT